MLTEELVTYVRAQLVANLPPAEITQVLLAQGWSEIDVSAALAQAVVPPPSQPVETTSQPMTIGQSNQVHPSSVGQSAQQADAITKWQQDSWRLKDVLNLKDMKWYEWLAALPGIFLFVRGGMVGAVFGLFCWTVSIKFSRHPSHSRTTKIMLVIGVIVGTYIVYFLVATILVALLSGFLQGQ